MAQPTISPNPFLSTLKAADAVPAVLHPLVLLSISDHITRHTLRKQQGPVVGALLGQQNGRQVTLEHTFDFAVDKDNEGKAQFDETWFKDRVEQSMSPPPKICASLWWPIVQKTRKNE